jgi:hypothetical protein
MRTIVREKATTPGPIGGASAVIERLKSIIRRLGETDCDTPENWRDPLSHPAIRMMSSRELADLPFAAGYGQRPCR